MSTTPGTTGIEITAKHSVLAWILIFFKPTFVVDGNASQQAWKTPTFVPTAPGQHQVQVHFAYLFLKTAGKAVTTVNVNPGEVVKVSYKAPWIVFLGGKISQG
jgi:hypothetical protein